MGKVREGEVSNNRFYAGKDRSDHRHHAIDAVVIALTEFHIVHKINTLRGQGKTHREIKKEKMIDVPWKNFRGQLKAHLDDMLIAYRKKENLFEQTAKKVHKKIEKVGENGKKVAENKIYKGRGDTARGKLHDATYYGRYDYNGNANYHVRTPLYEIESSVQIDKIVNPEIQKLAKEFLEREHGINTSQKKYKVPANAFFFVNEQGERTPRLFLPNKNNPTKPVPIKKVRLREVSSNAFRLYEGINKWVEPGENYCVIIHKGKKGREGIFVSFMEAVQRKKEFKKIDFEEILRSEGKSRYLMNLMKGDMVLIDYEQDDIDFDHLPPLVALSEKLYIVRKISQSGIVMAHHLAADVKVDVDIEPTVLRRSPNTLKCLKVKITPTGQLKKIPQ
jgi:CRISPR-associated endonuclease Csn1